METIPTIEINKHGLKYTTTNKLKNDSKTHTLYYPSYTKDKGKEAQIREVIIFAKSENLKLFLHDKKIYIHDPDNYTYI